MTFDYLAEKTMESFKKEVRDLYNKQSLAPCLILLFTFVDVLAGVRFGNKKTNKEQYKDFVKSYLLPHEGLDCTAKDIYKARCALLHNYSGPSKFFYFAYEKNKKNVQIKENEIAIHIEDLIDAFEKSIEKLKMDIPNINICEQLEIEGRATKWLQQIETKAGAR